MRGYYARDEQFEDRSCLCLRHFVIQSFDHIQRTTKRKRVHACEETVIILLLYQHNIRFMQAARWLFPMGFLLGGVLITGSTHERQAPSTPPINLYTLQVRSNTDAQNHISILIRSNSRYIVGLTFGGMLTFCTSAWLRIFWLCCKVLASKSAVRGAFPVATRLPSLGFTRRRRATSTGAPTSTN